MISCPNTRSIASGLVFLLLAVVALVPAQAVEIRIANDSPYGGILWQDFDSQLNCYVYRKWRLTTGIYQKFNAASAKECFRECAAQVRSPTSLILCVSHVYTAYKPHPQPSIQNNISDDDESYFECWSFTYSRTTKTCHLSETDGADVEGDAEYVKDADFIAGFCMDFDDGATTAYPYIPKQSMVVRRSRDME